MNQDIIHAIVTEFKNDIVWGQGIFQPEFAEDIQALSCQRDYVMCSVPTPLRNIMTKAINNQITTNLSEGIDLLENLPDRVPKCVKPEFKKYLVTMMEHDVKWFIDTNVYSPFSSLIVSPYELYSSVGEVIDKVKSLPEC